MASSHCNAVVMVTDGGYLPAARFVAHQLLGQSNRNFDVIILAIGCSPEQRATSDAQLSIIDFVPHDMSGFQFSRADRTWAAYAKINVTPQVDQRYTKILYLDADVWIGSRSLAHLFATELGDYPIAAVMDAGEVLRGDNADWLDYKKKLGMSAKTPYFNSGMMLINRRVFDGEAIGARVIDYLTSGRYIGRLDDQSALNAVLNGRWLELSPLWNWMYATRWTLTRAVDPGIIHFIGSSKPWRDVRGRHDTILATGEKWRRFWGRCTLKNSLTSSCREVG
ncbi:MAG: glycosyltransferase family 8 protein [Hyphomicrobium sp.]|nr:glycosyltransferase family 8 protein [Hyphomicrobium sp.]